MRELRERAGLKVIDVAYRMGVAESSIRNWERGRSIPRLTPEQFRLICSMYNCSFEEWALSYEETRAKYSSDKKN